MKNINNVFKVTLFGVIAFMMSCSKDFLDIKPNGVLDKDALNSYDGVNNLLIGAYAMLDGVSGNGFGWEAASSNWVFGSIRGGEANKGTDAGDQPDINPIQNYSETATNPYLNVKWRALYDGIARSNETIRIAGTALQTGVITQEDHDWFVKQARALRGFFHFEAYRMWEAIPFVDENADLAAVSNVDGSGNFVDPRSQIIADLDYAKDLPNDMGQIGRFNGTVVNVLLAKAHMQLNADYSTALNLLQSVVDSGTRPDGEAIGLEDTYGSVFNIENRNGPEAIYTVQYSVNDGSGGWNGGWGEVLNFPYKSGGSPGGCCGFYQPSHDFVNSFRTSGGLPMLDGSYNTGASNRDQGVPSGPVWDAEIDFVKGDFTTVYDPAEPYIDLAYESLTGEKNDDGDCIPCNVNNDPLTDDGTNWKLVWTEDNSLELDPRLDWTTGRRGIPYLDWGVHTGQDWIRDQSYAGPYSPKKQVYRKDQEGTYTEVGNWTSGWTANGYRLIRYADVLLLKAECEARLGQDDLGLGEVNQLRARAANPDGFVTEEDGTTPAANYNIIEYPAFADATFALEAILFERKLELGMEGHRFFDLKRFGVAQEELTRFLNHEKNVRSTLYISGAAFGVEDINYPIPERQIDLSNGNLVQNR